MTLWATGFLVLGFVLMLAWVSVANSDFRARSRTLVQIESEAESEAENGIQSFLILHRLIPEENAAEASLLLLVRGTAVDSIKAQGLKLRATLHERYEYPGGLLKSVSIDSIASAQESRRGVFVVSDRFTVPLYASVTDFPWDSYTALLSMEVTQQPDRHYAATFHVVKEFPGWEVRTVASALNMELTIQRPIVQKLVVLLSAVIFMLLSLFVIYTVVRGPHELSAISGSTAFAGFVLAVAGYREIVGLSTLPSVSWLDLIVLGVPLVALLIGFVAYYRRTKSRTEPLQ